MPKLPGINHLRAVKALEKRGYLIVRQRKHITMTDGRSADNYHPPFQSDR